MVFIYSTILFRCICKMPVEMILLKSKMIPFVLVVIRYTVYVTCFQSRFIQTRNKMFKIDTRGDN